MSVLTLIDSEEAELRSAFRHYHRAGQRKQAWRCWYLIQGLRRARAIVVRSADRLERAA